MSNRLIVEGAWPENLTVTRGWARGEARPWNDETAAGHLRLLRGSSAFLDEATSLVATASDGTVYSPALYPASTRIWKRVGYQPTSHLLVLEKGLSFRSERPARPIAAISSPDWDDILEVDRAAFEGFWRMSRAGLVEAAGATPNSTVLGFHIEDRLAGYAIVGTQRTASYLQRLAVDPEHSGQGLGTDLVRASFDWARRRGARSMILNVREQSTAARRLYQGEGFHDTGVRLEILSTTVLSRT